MHNLWNRLCSNIIAAYVSDIEMIIELVYSGITTCCCNSAVSQIRVALGCPSSHDYAICVCQTPLCFHHHGHAQKGTVPQHMHKGNSLVHTFGDMGRAACISIRLRSDIGLYVFHHV